MTPPSRVQRGSAAVLATVLAGALMVVATLVAAAGSVVVAQRRVETAVDLGALAGAAAAQDGREACPAAAGVVRRNAARMTGCRSDGSVVTVRAARTTPRMFGMRFTARSTARAGPAGTQPALRWARTWQGPR
jgi:secretion/DNA translocation related TadE-like protein